MNRKPTPKSQAEIIITEMASLGFTLQRGKALDLVGKLEGYKGWNELLKAEKKAKAPAKATVSTPPVPQLKYDTLIPAEMFSAQGLVRDENLAIFLKHGRNAISTIWADVTHTGRKAKADTTFDDLEIGETFWDSDCGEDFVKTGPTTARMIPNYGDDDGESPDDTFEPKFRVKRELYSLELCGEVRYKVTVAGKVGFVSSRNGMTDDMQAILSGAYPDRAESVDNAWFQWVNSQGDEFSEPFDKLPKNPMDAIRKHLLQDLTAQLEDRFTDTVGSKLQGVATVLRNMRLSG